MRIADELAERPPAGIPEQEVAEATELLRWLADDHFTFMGYREYVLDPDTDGEPTVTFAASPAPASGILRGRPGPVGELRPAAAPAARAGARDPQVLVLTKANSRSTVHRPAYLDYVGVKVFDDHGEVVGERRFLGLFTSAAYNESIQRIPVLRRKAAEVLLAQRLHHDQPLRQGPAADPRDLPARRAVPDLRRATCSRPS